MNKLVLAISVLFSFPSFAQMIPMTSTIRTPYGNVPYTYHVYSPTPHYYYNQGSISNKYEFTVVLKNDSMFDVRTRIDLPKDKGNHSITFKTKTGKQTLSPSDTKAITRITYEGKQLYGIAADSCWLFKTDAGRINSYSFLAEPGMSYIIAIQDGENGPIVPLTKENLQAIVGTGNEKINKLLAKDKLIKAVEEYNSKQ